LLSARRWTFGFIKCGTLSTRWGIVIIFLHASVLPHSEFMLMCVAVLTGKETACRVEKGCSCHYIYWYCIVLCCIVLYFIVLYCIVLYCVVLYCVVRYLMCCNVPYYIVLYYSVVYCAVLYCTVLHSVVLYCIV
jgi:hypothetical protein